MKTPNQPAHDGRLTTIVLDTPLKRGEQEIVELTLRKPSSGELRGLSLVRVGQMDVDEIRKLIPRISSPVLIDAEVDQLDVADLMEVAAAIGNFLLSKRQRAAFPTT